MSYFTSADDYKQFFELSNGSEKPSDDYVNIPGEFPSSPAGGVVQPTPSTADPMGPAPSTTSVEGFSYNKNTGKFEPFKFNKNTGKFEPFRNTKQW